MANRWCDGFGRYGGTKSYMLNGSSGQAWAQVDSNFALSNANPRTGNWHLRMVPTVGGKQEARRVFGAPLTEVFLGLAVYCHDLPSGETHGGAIDDDEDGTFLCWLRDQANERQCRLLLGSDGALELRNGPTVLGRSIPIIGAGAYQHIEVYAKAGTVDGAFEVRVDEVTRLNLTGIPTVLDGGNEFSQVAIGHEYGGAFSPTIDFADFFCNDTTADGSGCSTFVGDCKSGWLPVDADTAQADFALSAGTSGHSLLAETPPDDATYISTGSTAAESDFGLTDGPANLSEVLTVRPAVRAMKNDAGTCTIAPNIKSGAIKAAVDDQPITTAFAYYDSNVPVDPDTGVPWIAAGLATAEHVVERVS
jgi:hypothetical protein